ncbi:MAG TPA: hypothetical protein VF223_14115, partial [Trebonia sp.]
MRSSGAEPGGRLREIRAPFVVAAPEGARVRTRLRVSEQDAVVLEALGSYLGQLAGRDLAARCAQGRLDARGRAVSRQATQDRPGPPAEQVLTTAHCLGRLEALLEEVRRP